MFPIGLELTPLDGVLRLTLPRFTDLRGSLTKVFHQQAFADALPQFQVAEQYVTVSKPGVLRGMHFQVPPHQHDKLVMCLAGRVIDAVLDLRLGSPTYLQHHLFELRPEEHAALLIPAGYAHGFYTVEEATLLYSTTSVYAPSHDRGIRYDSVGITWPQGTPILSERDTGFPGLADFETPFVWKSQL